MDKSGLYPTYRSKLNHLLLLLNNLKSVLLELKKKVNKLDRNCPYGKDFKNILISP